MTEQISASSAIRPDMVGIAVGFLQSLQVANEPMDRKRMFLQKKGLTDMEINHAFEQIPLRVIETTPSQPPSLLSRLLKDLVVAGLLAFLIKLFRRSFRSTTANELPATIEALQKSIQEMQASVIKLEQASDQLNVKIRTANSARTSSTSIEQIRQDIQALKEAFLSRSQFPDPRSNVSVKTTTNRTTTDSDNDGIIVLSASDKKSDDENVPSNDH